MRSGRVVRGAGRFAAVLVVAAGMAVDGSVGNGQETDELRRGVHPKAVLAVHVTDFGAKGNWNYADGTGADDSEAVQRAVDHAARADSASNVVYFPAGNYRISTTIRLPNWVRLRGDNGRNSQIHADPNFSGESMFHAANDGQSMFHSRLEELWLRVHGNPSIKAVVKADAWQENDGLSRVVISGFTRYAVEIEFGHGGAATLRIEDCEFFADAEAQDESAGVYVHPISRVAGFLLRVDSTTITGVSASKPLTYGILMENDTLVARCVHFEYTKHGIFLRGKANVIADGLTGSYTKTNPASLLTLDRTSTGFVTARGLLPNGYDDTIQDNRSGNHRKGTVVEIIIPEM